MATLAYGIPGARRIAWHGDKDTAWRIAVKNAKLITHLHLTGQWGVTVKEFEHGYVVLLVPRDYA